MRTLLISLASAVTVTLITSLSGCTYYDSQLCTSDRLVDLPQFAGHYEIMQDGDDALEVLEILPVSPGVFKPLNDGSAPESIMRTCMIDGKLSMENQTGTVFELFGLSVSNEETLLTRTDLDPALIESGRVPGECKTEEVTHITYCTVANSRMRTPGEMTQWLQPEGEAIHLKRDLPPSL